MLPAQKLLGAGTEHFLSQGNMYLKFEKKNLHNPHHHPRSTQPPSHKSHQHLTLTKENKWQASLLLVMFGREGISYFHEITQLIQINPITLSLYDPTAKISDHTFLGFYPTILVFYPTIRGEIPLFYYYIIIPLLLFLSSPPTYLRNQAYVYIWKYVIIFVIVLSIPNCAILRIGL